MQTCANLDVGPGLIPYFEMPVWFSKSYKWLWTHTVRAWNHIRKHVAKAWNHICDIDRVLSYVENVFAVLITLTLGFILCHEFYWLLAGDGGWWGDFNVAQRHKRLTILVTNLDEHWRAGLLLFVPLFYRTIRSLLSKLTRWGNVEFDNAKGSSKDNPKNLAKEMKKES